MDPVSLSAAAVALLSPVVTKLLDRAAEESSNAVFDKVRELYRTVRGRFGSDSYAAGALERFEADPENPQRQGILQDALAEVVTEDPAFAATLRDLVEQAQAAAGVTMQWTSEGGAAAGRDFVQNATYAAGRDQHFGRPPV